MGATASYRLLRLGRYHSPDELLPVIVAFLCHSPSRSFTSLVRTLHPQKAMPWHSVLQQILNHKTSLPSSRVKLPLLQPTPVRLFHRRTPARHLHIRRLHVLLRQARADLLVRLGVGFLAVARAVAHALARDAGFEGRVVGVRGGLGLGAFGAGGRGRSLRRCAWPCCLGGFGVKAWMTMVG